MRCCSNSVAVMYKASAPPNFVWRNLVFLGPQYGTCFLSPFWHQWILRWLLDFLENMRTPVSPLIFHVVLIIQRTSSWPPFKIHHHHHHHLPPWFRSFDLFWHRRIAIVSWGVHGLFFLEICSWGRSKLSQLFDTFGTEAVTFKVRIFTNKKNTWTVKTFSVSALNLIKKKCCLAVMTLELRKENSNGNELKSSLGKA